MFESAPNPTALRDFRTHLRGELILPSDDGYDSARRVWNGTIDKYPALICRCANRTDVLRAVDFAHSQQLTVAVRGGGHSLIGQSVCDGGIVIDLAQMKGMQVDPVKCTARAEAGLTLGEFVRRSQPFGLVTTTGTVAGTGLSGLTLGGGLGWFMGKYGLTIDNLLSVEIVTADGRVLTASATSHPDLFWGVRGGGGNFGIVTAFEFRMHPVGQVLAGKVVYPMTRARDVLRFYREYTSTAPDELTAYASLMTTPTGHPAIAINLCYCGNLDEGERVVAPVRKFGLPLVDLIRPRPYLTVITCADAGAPDGRNYYQKASTLKHLSDEAIDAIADYSAVCPSPFSQVLIQHVHGAASRVSPTETAFALRDESYVVSIVAAWEDDQANLHRAWTHRFWTAMQPFASKGVYVNFLDEEREEQVRATYGVNYDRLAALKNTYDPTNFFSLNQNIRPTMKRLHPLAQNWSIQGSIKSAS
ncbi:MAG TPA: FAD-binding oxidoreductase [Ktedonobacteraceae bacterium]|jgi:FAD/FMN-containing dehydrogenase|nr:FAD-binding oxidoreductase [Ktedonobacteraceae bacterium]